MKKIAKWIILFLLIVLNLLFLDGKKEGLSQSREKTHKPEMIKRDPFALPSGVRLRSQGDTPQEVKSNPTPSISKEILPQETVSKEVPLKLKAILITDSIRLATINQTIVQEGDFVQEEKISEIHSDRVILVKGGKTRTLLLDQSPVKLVVEQPSFSPFPLKREVEEIGGIR